MSVVWVLGLNWQNTIYAKAQGFPIVVWVLGLGFRGVRNLFDKGFSAHPKGPKCVHII